MFQTKLQYQGFCQLDSDFLGSYPISVYHIDLVEVKTLHNLTQTFSSIAQRVIGKIKSSVLAPFYLVYLLKHFAWKQLLQNKIKIKHFIKI
jgi:hypothetical protein